MDTNQFNKLYKSNDKKIGKQFNQNPDQIENFLSFLLKKKVLIEKYLGIVDIIFTAGSPIEQFYQKQTKQATKYSGVCHVSWSGEDIIIYQCLECGIDPTSCLCSECFEKGNHKGHHYRIRKGGSGMCDCGNPDAWNPKGFCPDHKGPPKNLESFLEEDLQIRLKILIKCVCKYLTKLVVKRLYTAKKQANLDTNSTDELHERTRKKLAYSPHRNEITLILDWFTKIFSIGGGISRIAGRIMSNFKLPKTDFTTLEILMRITTYETGTVHKSGKNCFYKALFDLPFKRNFTRHYLKLYRSMLIRSIQKDDYDSINTVNNSELCEFSVQMFTSASLVDLFVNETNFLKTLFETFHSITKLLQYKNEDLNDSKCIQLSHPILDTHNYMVLVFDMQYILRRPFVTNWIMIQNEKILKIWLSILLKFQSMNPIEKINKKTNPKENEGYVSSFNVELYLNQINRLLQNGLLIGANKINERTSLEESLKRHQLTKPLLEKIQKIFSLISNLIKSWTIKNHEYFQDLNSEILTIKTSLNNPKKVKCLQVFNRKKKKKDQINEEEKIYNLKKKRKRKNTSTKFYISMHYPLHRFFSLLLAGVIKQWEDEIDILSLFSSPNMSYQYCHGFIEIVIHIIRLQSVCSQIRARLWNRNGLNIYYQVQLLKNPLLNSFCTDLDIFLVQISSVLLDPDHIINLIINEFLLDNFFYLTNNCFETFLKTDYGQSLTLICKDFFRFLGTVLLERTHAGELSKEMKIERELIHLLCLEDQKFSDLVDNLPRDLMDEEQLIEQILTEIAIQTSNEKKFRLKPEYWKKFEGAYFPHYNQKQYSQAEENYFEHIKRSNQKILNDEKEKENEKKNDNENEKKKKKLPLSYPFPKYNPTYKPLESLTQLLHCHSLFQILFVILYNAKQNSLMVTEEVFTIALHLIYLSINTPISEKQKKFEKENEKEKTEINKEKIQIFNKNFENNNKKQTEDSDNDDNLEKGSDNDNKQSDSLITSFFKSFFRKNDSSSQSTLKKKKKVYEELSNSTLKFLDIQFSNQINLIENATLKISLPNDESESFISLLIYLYNSSERIEHHGLIKDILALFCGKSKICEKLISKKLNGFYEKIEKEKLKEKKRLIRERQRKLMLKMNLKQENFLKKFEKDFNTLNDIDDDNDNDIKKDQDQDGNKIENTTSISDPKFCKLKYKKHYKSLICSLCHENFKNEKTQSIGLITLIHQSTTLENILTIKNDKLISKIQNEKAKTKKNANSNIKEKNHNINNNQRERETEKKKKREGEGRKEKGKEMKREGEGRKEKKREGEGRKERKREGEGRKEKKREVEGRKEKKREGEGRKEKKREGEGRKEKGKEKKKTVKKDLEKEKQQEKKTEDRLKKIYLKKLLNFQKIKRNTITGCGHLIHSHCYQDYQETLLKELRQRSGYYNRNYIDFEKGQFLCPLDRNIVNNLLPIVPNKLIIQHEIDKNQRSFPFRGAHKIILNLYKATKKISVNEKYSKIYKALQTSINNFIFNLSVLSKINLPRDPQMHCRGYLLLFDFLTRFLSNTEIASRTKRNQTISSINQFTFQTLFRICLIFGKESERGTEVRAKLKTCFFNLLFKGINSKIFKSIFYKHPIHCLTYLVCLLGDNLINKDHFFACTHLIIIIALYHITKALNLKLVNYQIPSKNKLLVVKNIKNRLISILRFAYLFHKFGIDQNSTSEPYAFNLNSFDELASFFKIPLDIEKILKLDIVHFFFAKWQKSHTSQDDIGNNSTYSKSNVNTKERTVTLKRFLPPKISRFNYCKPFKFIEFPDNFAKLWNKFIMNKTIEGRPIPKQAAICMITGEMIDLAKTQSSILNEESLFDIKFHAQKMGGVGLYLAVKGIYASGVFVLHEGFGIVPLETFYLDKWNESDIGIKRGKTLIKNDARLLKLQELYLNNQLFDEISKFRRKNPNLVIFN
ncbi:ubiquitin ligase e3 alpha-related [Anaeramoeba flamelloides]|uniref:E3 ubiquitin-protein ligase n=1 Tax=Anaeramoeba flamelloides TaxID=1746091 RepID=A0AAV7YPQ8_9EUKA|nr:ubiquitin ligase e3 alpha-related [Anaeramoeba flamelloides]